MASSPRPHLRDLVEELHEAASKWRAIGLQLGLPQSSLRATDYANKGDCNQALSEMLDEWLKALEDVSWAAVVAALRTRSVGENALASQLEAKYCPGAAKKPAAARGGAESSASARKLTQDATLPFLHSLPYKKGNSDQLKIIERASPKYSQLGTFLLADDDGSKVNRITMACHYNPEAAMREIFQEWISSEDHSWKTLIYYLRLSGLNTLASNIEEALQQNGVSI